MIEALRRKGIGATVSLYISAVVLILLIAYNCIFTIHFISWSTFSNFFIQVAQIAIVSLGMNLVIATGGIDISVGSAMGLGATIAAMFLFHNQPAGLLFSLLVLICFGALSGMLISVFHINPMVVTLALMYIMRGMAKGISGGTVTYNAPNLTNYFVTPLFGHIPVQFFIVLFLAFIMYFIVNRMRLGSYISAFGNNPMSSRLCGINTNLLLISCYIMAAICAWASGILAMVTVSSADPSSVGLDMETNAIAAVVIGGTPITGGYPNIIGTICGAFLLQLINMMCNMNNVSYPMTLIIKACIIILALFAHTLLKKIK